MFIVLKVTNPGSHIKGYLKRFLFEPERNVFVGNASRRVIDGIWERITQQEIKDETDIKDDCNKSTFNASLIISRKDMEQGFEYKYYSDDESKVNSFKSDGIELFGSFLDINT